MRELDHDSLFGLYENALPECLVADVMELIETNESMIRRLTGMLCDATDAEGRQRKPGCGASGGEDDPTWRDPDPSRCGTSRTDDQAMGRLSDRLMIAADSFAGSRKHRSAPALPSDKWIAAYLALMRRRREFVGDDLIADPCWEMLVDLCIAEQRGDRISTSSLCIASSAPRRRRCVGSE